MTNKSLALIVSDYYDDYTVILICKTWDRAIEYCNKNYTPHPKHNNLWLDDYAVVRIKSVDYIDE